MAGSDQQDTGCFNSETVVALVDGRLRSDQLTVAENHVATCETCADRVALAADGQRQTLGARGESRSVALPRRSSIARYVMIDLVGRGGMGEVYVAYDPQLDRKVAVKLLHQKTASSDSRARVRLLREAKAMARLSHPNVVVLHDAGEIDGRVFLAMEFVDGQTLAAWLKESPRGWREIRDAFLAAGRGLAAAHDAGLVHRDFKPQNVMVGRDGTVRVMDFGLASDATTNQSDSRVNLESTSPILEYTVGLTRTGTLLGTPLYMAPEQFQGLRADPRTDQFSFCVSLYHALYAERPFAGESVVELAEAVIAGRIREPPQKSNVPSRLRAAIFRGLEADPANRFPSMGALINALEYDPKRRYRTIAASVGVAIVLAVGMVGMRATAGRGERLCRGGSARLAGIWETGTGARRATVKRAFLGTGRPFAADTWKQVAGLLDQYADRWMAAYTDTCEATHVRGEQSAEVLDLRMICLQEPLMALRALTDIFSHADADTLLEARKAADALPPIEPCADATALRGGIRLPADPQARRQVETLRATLANVRALHQTGKLTDARRKAEPLVDQVKATEYKPLIADALLELGGLVNETGAFGEAVRTYKAAFVASLAARRDDVAFQVAVHLEMILDYHLAKHEEAKAWDELAAALLERLGRGHEREAATLLKIRALVAQQRGDFRSALTNMEQTLALEQQRPLLSSDEYGGSWNGIAVLKLELEDLAGALEAIDKSLEIARSMLVSESPQVAMQLMNRGEILEALGRHTEARAHQEEALRRWESWLPPDHLWLAYPLTGLGNALRSEGRPQEALPVLERALRIREAAEQSPQPLAETRFALARTLWDIGGDHARARTLAIAARDAYRSVFYTARAGHIEDWLTAHPAGRPSPTHVAQKQ